MKTEIAGIRIEADASQLRERIQSARHRMNNEWAAFKAQVAAANPLPENPLNTGGRTLWFCPVPGCRFYAVNRNGCRVHLGSVHPRTNGAGEPIRGRVKVPADRQLSE